MIHLATLKKDYERSNNSHVSDAARNDAVEESMEPKKTTQNCYKLLLMLEMINEVSVVFLISSVVFPFKLS